MFFVDASVRQAHGQGWDGTGVNVTVLDFGQRRYVDTIEIEQTLDGTIEYFNGRSLQTTSIAEVSTVAFELSHSDVVNGFATGMDWERKFLGQFNLALDNNCEGSKQSSFSSGTYTISGTLNLKQIIVANLVLRQGQWVTGKPLRHTLVRINRDEK